MREPGDDSERLRVAFEASNDPLGLTGLILAPVHSRSLEIVLDRLADETIDGLVECPLAGVAEWGMAEVMSETCEIQEVGIRRENLRLWVGRWRCAGSCWRGAKLLSQTPSELCHLEAVCQSRMKGADLGARDHLALASKSAERVRIQQPISILGERVARIFLASVRGRA